MSFSDAVTLAPFIAAVLVAAAILVVDFIAPGRKAPALATAFIGLAFVAALTVLVGQAVITDEALATAFNGSYRVDALTTFLDLLFISIVALSIAFAPDYLEERGLPVAEFSAILVFAMSGAMLLAASADLLVLFLGLELMVLPGYILAGYHKSDGFSTEGAIKYFLLGSFSSAIFLFGLAFVWGITGTTRIDGVAQSLTLLANGTAALSPALGMGLAFMTTGVAFKIAAVPFHYWTPDAYQGSPTPVTGYLSVGPKIGAFALIIRLFGEALGPLAAEWNVVIMILAAMTMTLGNLVALTQDNVKRMLAYSSIAHTGYMLVGFAAFGAGQIQGMEGLLYYGAAYTFMNLGLPNNLHGPSANNSMNRSGPVNPCTVMFRAPVAYRMLMGSAVSSAGMPLRRMTSTSRCLRSKRRLSAVWVDISSYLQCGDAVDSHGAGHALQFDLASCLPDHGVAECGHHSFGRQQRRIR